MKQIKTYNLQVVHVATGIAIADFIMLKSRYIPFGFSFPYGKYIEDRKDSICRARGLNPQYFKYRFV